MSAPDLNFQAQVESVLSQLVKVATVELTKLFETRYQTFVGAIVRSERRNQTLETPERLEEPDGKAASCSIGVQVNALNNETTELSVPLNLSGRGDCLKSKEEEEEEEEEGVSPTDTITEEENGHVDRLGLLVKEDENQSTVKSEADTQTCCVTDAISHDHQTPRSSPSPTAKPLPVKPLPVKSEAESEVIAEGPLFPKQELWDPEVDPPEPAVVPAPVQSEPQQTNVSTAKGMAYSPSPLDGAAVASLPQVEAWECVSPAKEDTQNDLQMKLKRAGHPHRGLVRPCSVRLVNIEAAAKSTGVPKSAAAAAARHATGSSSSSSSPPPPPPPKDLRRHQGLHTGHRLCCYTACSNGVWRLQGAVAHARNRYPCKVCGKNFKRRKILRRHERFHTGEKPYPCVHCSKTFALRKSLRRHGRFHTGERPHDCTQCGKSFRLRENLKAHLRFHSGEKPYVCSICGKSFRIARNLEKHNTGQCGFLVPSFRKIAGFVSERGRKTP